jgi:glycosyltransferase involved in cell wall biosynthesis
VEASLTPATAVVSIIIPVYNQARYLGEAIESVQSQSYPHREILVVDDGSSDDPASVVARYEGARLIRQVNAGTAAARNSGIRLSRGELLVLLDADDRLLPGALDRGVEALSACPDFAFVFGRARMMDSRGVSLPIIQDPNSEPDTYRALLERCPIWNPGSVMCRRFIFEQGVSFDSSMVYCSDYLFYLTVARRWPTASHDALVSEYRQHEQAKSTHGARMMRYLLRALRAQAEFVRGSPRWRAARRRGMGNCRRDYYRPAVRELVIRLRSNSGGSRALADLGLLLQVTPLVLPRLIAGELYRRARRASRGRTFQSP